MNKAMNYIENLLTNVKQGVETNYDHENGERLIREAYKVDQVFHLLNFCSAECRLDFAQEDLEGEPSKATKTSCFNSCAAKTFEAKQLEHFYRDTL